MTHYRRGQKVQYGGTTWILIKFRWRDYSTGEQVWLAKRMDVEENGLIYL